MRVPKPGPRLWRSLPLVAVVLLASTTAARAASWRRASPPLAVVEAADGTATRLFVAGGGTVARRDPAGTWSDCGELPKALLATWASSGRPLRLAVARNGRGVVALGPTGQLARSADCATWTVPGVAADGVVSSGNRILAWRGTVVRASDDGGGHWRTLPTDLPTPLGGLRLVGAPGAQGTVVALLGTSGRVACSRDGGETFRLTDAMTDGAAVDAAGDVWIGVGTGLATSSDGCRNWTRLAGPGLPRGIRAVGAGADRVWAIDARDRLWRYAPGNATWAPVLGAGTPTAVVDGVSPDAVILGGRLRLVEDDDARLADASLHLLGGTTTVQAAAQARTLVATTRGELRFLVAPSGAAWSERRLPNGVDPDAVKLLVSPRGRLLVVARATRRYVAVSTNTGTSWRAQHGDATLMLAARSDPYRRTRLWVVGHAIRYSDDDGRTWHISGRAPWTPGRHARPIATGNGRTGLLIDDANGHKGGLSLDGGRTWSRIPGVPDEALVVDGGAGRILSWDGSALRRMVPGVGWKRWESGLPDAIRFFPYHGPLVVLPSGTAYLGLRGALWTRAANARAWTRVAQSPQRIVALIPTASGLVVQADAKVRVLLGVR